MLRSTVFAVSTLVLVTACGESAKDAGPLTPPQASAPKVELPAVPLPPLPSTTDVSAAATAKDSAATDPKGR